MKKKAALSLVLMLCLLLSACSGPKTFAAKYETKSGSEQLEFFKDGTVELYSKNMLVTGTYEKIGTHTYEVRLTYLFVQMRYTAVRAGDTITLTDNSSGKVHTYYLVGRNTDSSSVPEQRPWNVDDEELK